MASRDRRRRGAHSAGRRTEGSAPDPDPDGGSAPAEPPGPTGDVGSPSQAQPTRTAAVRSGDESPAGAGAAPVAASAAETPDLGSPMTRRERRLAASGAAQSGTERSKTKRSKTKRTWLDWLLLSGVALVSLAIIAMGTGYAYVQYLSLIHISEPTRPY